MRKEGPPVTITPDSRKVDKRIKARIQLAFKGLDQARKGPDSERDTGSYIDPWESQR